MFRAVMRFRQGTETYVSCFLLTCIYNCGAKFVVARSEHHIELILITYDLFKTPFCERIVTSLEN